MMEYVPSLSLEDLVSSMSFYVSNDPKDTSLKIFKLGFSIARALRTAHFQGLYHLNLKPSNIF
jgi:serine/threonine protein kinase